MDRYSDIKEKLIEYANLDEDIKALVAIGSSTRDTVKADEYSDLDVLIITDNTKNWFSGEYPALLGDMRISFIEPTLGGGRERRCIYDEDRDVDMIILTPGQFEAALVEGVAGMVMNRGYKVMYDSVGFSELIPQYVVAGKSEPDMSEEEFNNMVNDFYFHNIWACKKLKRGEIWSAKMCVDAYLKNYLLKMIELYCYRVCKKDVWHDGRFLDRWADSEILEQLKNCFAHYDRDDILRALRATHNLFDEVAVAVAEAEGYEYPKHAKDCAKAYIG